MAQSENKNRLRRTATTLSRPVQASARIFHGSIVQCDADGDCLVATNAANQTILGVAAEEADNRNGADGDINVTILRGQAFLFAVKAGDTPAIGAKVYVEDDETVTTTAAGRTELGRVLDKDENSNVWVLVE